MSKLQVTFEHLDYGMRRRVAAENLEKGETVEEAMARIIHDGVGVEISLVVPKKKKEPVKKTVKKAVKKVVKKVTKKKK